MAVGWLEASYEMVLRYAHWRRNPRAASPAGISAQTAATAPTGRAAPAATPHRPGAPPSPPSAGRSSSGKTLFPCTRMPPASRPVRIRTWITSCAASWGPKKEGAHAWRERLLIAENGYGRVPWGIGSSVQPSACQSILSPPWQSMQLPSMPKAISLGATS